MNDLPHTGQFKFGVTSYKKMSSYDRKTLGGKHSMADPDRRNGYKEYAVGHFKKPSLYI
jgi:hypothetical protein